MEDKPLMLDGMDGYQFEELIAKIMKKRGYEKIKVTSKSRDVGKDIIMNGQNGELVLVECKHQNFVGRPIIQKLQGAMNHEEEKHPDKEVKGIIVTSGSFSKEAMDYNKEIGQEIELIDGKKLKDLCEELKVVILNGKIQIIANESFKNISEEESKELAQKGYSKIYGNKKHKIAVNPSLKYYPACFIKYNLSFDTHTSIGCVDSYSDSDEVIIDGVNGDELDEEKKEFFFSGRLETEEIPENGSANKIQFEFTENDIEEYAINSIIAEHTHNVGYTGNNNVTYTKTCIPKRRDIDIKQFAPIYLPLWTNEISLLKMNYKQGFFVKGNNLHYLNDELKKCKICGKHESDYGDMSLCLECGRIICNHHVKIDYLDKETPICTIHAKALKLYIQNKFFATKENRKEYKDWWNSRNFFEKLYEDKIAFGLSITAGCILLIFIVNSL